MLIIDALGPIAAIGSWALILTALWKWGMTGLVERMQAFVRRLAHGPAPRARGLDYAMIARLEREIYGQPITTPGVPTSDPQPHPAPPHPPPAAHAPR